jgi:N-terminal acetyltransferase B complex non-catalytic subunit
VNSFKFLRFNLLESDITVELESARVEKYLKYYLEALPLGAQLPSTELQPTDDLALLAGNALVNLWTLTNRDAHLLNAVYLLEFGLTKSKQSFLMRLILIRIYRILGKVPFFTTSRLVTMYFSILGAPSLALEHYRAMNIKQVQHDTLSHLILSRASTFSLAATGDLTLASECLESTQVYLSNSQEVCQNLSARWS